MTDPARRQTPRPSFSARHEVEHCGQGMRVRNTALFLDATRVVDLSFVSHAHSDHSARHRKIVATSATLRLLAHRLGQLPMALPVPFRQPFTLDGMQIELFPAGHILGSAQIRVTHKNSVITYTGDLNLVPGLTVETAQVARCDTLVIESTFGLPRYRFPPREETYQAIRDFATQTLNDGAHPVFLAYSLGKSQEAMHLLASSGFSLVAHSDIAAMCDIYAQQGHPIAYRRFDGTLGDGEVLFFPPHLGQARTLEHLGKLRTAMLTGWALDQGTRFRLGTDAAFPLSDHADFEQLVQYVKDSGAKKVLTVHGFTKEFAACLRDRGIAAQPLVAPKQLELF